MLFKRYGAWLPHSQLATCCSTTAVAASPDTACRSTPRHCWCLLVEIDMRSLSLKGAFCLVTRNQRAWSPSHVAPGVRRLPPLREADGQRHRRPPAAQQGRLRYAPGPRLLFLSARPPTVVRRCALLSPPQPLAPALRDAAPLLTACICSQGAPQKPWRRRQRTPWQLRRAPWAPWPELCWGGKAQLAGCASSSGSTRSARTAPRYSFRSLGTHHAPLASHSCQLEWAFFAAWTIVDSCLPLSGTPRTPLSARSSATGCAAHARRPPPSCSDTLTGAC